MTRQVRPVRFQSGEVELLRRRRPAPCRIRPIAPHEGDSPAPRCRSVTRVPEVSTALTEALKALYAVEPHAFMAARRELVATARAGGDRESATEIGKLRKPTVAAWAVNVLARQAPKAVQQLVDLGSRMRAAQARLDAATLTALRPERDETVRRYVSTAVEIAAASGRTLAPAALEDIRATAVAALADEGASAAVSSGQLTRALSYSGFGEVDLSEAVARTASGAILTVVSGTGPGRPDAAPSSDDDEAEASAQAATAASLQEELAVAQARLEEAEQSVVAAREYADETRQRLAVVERQLAKAREADERALEAVTDAVRARKQATAARDAAQQALAESEQ